MASGLEIEDVHKRFGETLVLQGVDVQAPEGQITVLLGPNGAGKTTLFRIVMGLVRADAGRARVGGTDVLHLPLHAKAEAGLGYLPQDSSSFPELSAQRNIQAILEVRVRDRRDRQARLRALVQQTGLEAVAHRPYGALSGGERRRVEIAKSLALDPRVLLMDEPFAGLDPRIRLELLDLMRGMAASGVGLLFTDHDVHAALTVAKSAYLLAGGRVVFEGAPQDLVREDVVRNSYLGPTSRAES